jgi:poly(beta-D-mannuronate) lyase
VWLLPFLDLYPQHALALRLQARAGPAATAYGQLGGRLAAL